jgi:hypothetical protein
MNAYELADRLFKANFKESANMIIQQADRIAHLEMLVANRNEIIDKLDLTTPQIKELSDEEILSLSAFKNSSYDVFIEYEKEDLIKFARAILKKASDI